MNILELKDNFYWTGVQDPDLKAFDIIMLTEFGTSYNSYLLKGSKKTALLETAKLNFYDTYKQSVEAITDIASIDYIIVNHTEPDHVGSVEQLLALNPNLTLVGTTSAINFLKNIVNHPFESIIVKDHDTLSLGDMTLRFMPLPNLHWPDTMYTYWEEKHVLFTCDSFGAHYSHPEVLRSTVTREADYLGAVKFYFDNILAPFKSPYMQRALERIKDLEIDMICTGHGPVLDSHIPEIIELYTTWCKSENPNSGYTVIIPYVSAYGYTKTLATTIQKGLEANEGISVRTYDMEESNFESVVKELEFCDGFLLGTPTIVGDALKPIWELTLSLHTTALKGKLASAFGSYGWSGEGVPNIIERLKQLKLTVLDGYRVKFKPNAKELEEAYCFGKQFGATLLTK
ncbi:MAG: FprA family A-type flavoprotein [Lachnospiraceae bacterium]